MLPAVVLHGRTALARVHFHGVPARDFHVGISDAPPKKPGNSVAPWKIDWKTKEQEASEGAKRLVGKYTSNLPTVSPGRSVTRGVYKPAPEKLQSMVSTLQAAVSASRAASKAAQPGNGKQKTDTLGVTYADGAAYYRGLVVRPGGDYGIKGMGAWAAGRQFHCRELKWVNGKILAIGDVYEPARSAYIGNQAFSPTELKGVQLGGRNRYEYKGII